jgi:hypothetical protein
MLKGLGIKSTKSFPLAVVEQAIEDPSPELFELAAAAEDESNAEPIPVANNDQA